MKLISWEELKSVEIIDSEIEKTVDFKTFRNNLQGIKIFIKLRGKWVQFVGNVGNAITEGGKSGGIRIESDNGKVYILRGELITIFPSFNFKSDIIEISEYDFLETGAGILFNLYSYNIFEVKRPYEIKEVGRGI